MNETEKLPPLLTVDEMAGILRISRIKAYQIVKAPNFPIIKIGRTLRIPTKGLFIWLDSQYQTI